MAQEKRWHRQSGSKLPHTKACFRPHERMTNHGSRVTPPSCGGQKAAPTERRAVGSRENWRTIGGVLSFGLQTRKARLPKRGTSGSVQRGPANPARPGREQRYRVSQVCRGDPEVPRIAKAVFSCQFSVFSKTVGCLADICVYFPNEIAKDTCDQISATSDQETVGCRPRQILHQSGK